MKPSSGAFTIDVRRVRVLRELQQRGTVGATAKALSLTPSAISQQIATLSREVGVPLLLPQGRGVRLTPQAQLLLEHAAAVDVQLERARADLAAFDEGAVGRVTIGTFATAIGGIVVPALEHIRRERPRLRLSVREIGAPACFTELDRGGLDVVVTVDYRSGPHRGDARYARHDLLDDPLLLAIPRGHPLAAEGAIDLLALAKEPWVVGGTAGPCQEIGLSACAAAGFTPDITHQVDDYGALLRLVASGGCVGLVPQLALAGGVPEGVILRPPRGPQRPCRHVYAAIRAGAERSPNIVPVLAALASAAQERSVEGDRVSSAGRDRRRRAAPRGLRELAVAARVDPHAGARGLE